MKIHHYKASIEWTGNNGKGTSDYRAYSRSHEVSIDGKYDVIKTSSDPSFRGDPSRYNPEELFLSSLSSCHMLWYLHLCAVNNVVVVAYTDQATGQMEETENGSGRFTSVVLQPKVVIESTAQQELAIDLHSQANKMCFIANSCNFDVRHRATVEVK